MTNLHVDFGLFCLFKSSRGTGTHRDTQDTRYIQTVLHNAAPTRRPRNNNYLSDDAADFLQKLTKST